MRNLKGKNILVTGGAGFIGSHLIDRLLGEGVNSVYAIDNLFLGNEKNLANAFMNKNFTFYNDDIENYHILESIIESNKINIVFNCATKALNYSFINPHNSFITNVNGVLNLLEIQRKGGFESLCHFSTSEVYGTAKYEPMDESHPKNPLTTYAAGKAAADLAIDSYTRMFDLDTIIVRPFNNYGPRQNYKGYLAAVIPITIYRILKGLKPKVYGEGVQSRDFIYVYDTIDAVIKLFQVLDKGNAVNISISNRIKIIDIINKISNNLNYKGPITYHPKRDSDVDSHLACNKKLNKMINLNQTPIDEGLDKTILWYKDILN